MTPSELNVVAVLAASRLTGAASLGVVWLQEARRARSSARARLGGAGVELLARSAVLALRAETLRVMINTRSGLGEGIGVVLRIVKPVDARELHDWIVVDWLPMNRAWAEIWAGGDQELISRANNVVRAGGEVMRASTEIAAAATLSDRARRAVLGERSTPLLRREQDDALLVLADARERLTATLRSAASQPPAALTGGRDAQGSPGLAPVRRARRSGATAPVRGGRFGRPRCRTPEPPSTPAATAS